MKFKVLLGIIFSLSIALGTGLVVQQAHKYYVKDQTTTNKVSIESPALSSSYSMTLPTSNGSSGQFLQNNGSGVLSWQTVPSNYANQSLSNLTSPTSVNQDLIPNGTKNLGNSTDKWSTGNFVSSLLYGSTSGAITQQAANTTTSYSVKWPASQGAASTFLQNDGSGNLSWVAGGGAGANQSLSNLTSPTAVNQSLLPGAANSYGLGNTSNVWTGLFTQAMQFQNSSSGIINISPPAGFFTTYSLTLPSVQGGANQTLLNNGSGVLSWGSPSASPAGSNGQVQFNNSGSLGADSTFFWDNTNKRLGIGNNAPSTKLTVQDQAATSTGFRTNKLTEFVTNANGADGYIQISDGVANSMSIGHKSGDTYFAQNGVEKMRIGQGGIISLGGSTGNLVQVFPENGAQEGGQINLLPAGANTVTQTIDSNGNGMRLGSFTGAGFISMLTNSTERLLIDSAGKIYPIAIHNNGSGCSGATSQLCSGTYSPTVTCVQNCSTPVSNTSLYSRVGRIVTVGWRVTANNTLANQKTIYAITLPIASNLTTDVDLTGSGGTGEGASPGSRCYGDVTNDRALCEYTEPNVGGHNLGGTFQYLVN